MDRIQISIMQDLRNQGVPAKEIARELGKKGFLTPKGKKPDVHYIYNQLSFAKKKGIDMNAHLQEEPSPPIPLETKTEWGQVTGHVHESSDRRLAWAKRFMTVFTEVQALLAASYSQHAKAHLFAAMIMANEENKL